MDFADHLAGIYEQVRRFTDRHVRLFAIILLALFLPGAFVMLAPAALVAVAPLETSFPAPPAAAQSVALTFLDQDGRPLGRRGPVLGRPVKLADLPAYVPAAFVAQEDRRFYSHHGVDFLGLVRAAFIDLRARHFVAGGSTISQQTAKLVFDDRSRTLGRKLRELENTASLEKNFSKPQILEIYLNHIYLGENAYGVDAAARGYFGVPAQNLTLAQAAMLAALTKAPTVFSPRRDLAAARARAVHVLSAMVDTGAITEGQAQYARAHPATLAPPPRDDHNYVLDAAASEALKLAQDNGIASQSLIVHTTLNSALQDEAKELLARTVAKSGPKQHFSQAALVVMTPDGAISSMVGGVDYGSSVFNRVTQAHRQPGSAFKPFVYLTALESGISPWDWRDDQAGNISGYEPANYKNESYGRLRLTDALARSVNTISVNLGVEVGLPNVVATAHRLGINSALHANPSLTLGTDVVTPLELTAAYGAFANGGRVVQPHLVEALDDAATGAALYRRGPDKSAPVIADQVRRDMTYMLYNVVISGTGAGARLPGREAAGKTGTTQDYRDGWFVGFTADHVAGVWVGNDDNSPMKNVTGGSVPAQLWKAVMLAAEGTSPPVALDRTAGPPPGLPDAEEASATYVDDPASALSSGAMMSGGNPPSSELVVAEAPPTRKLEPPPPVRQAEGPAPVVIWPQSAPPPPPQQQQQQAAPAFVPAPQVERPAPQVAANPPPAIPMMSYQSYLNRRPPPPPDYYAPAPPPADYYAPPRDYYPPPPRTMQPQMGPPPDAYYGSPYYGPPR